MKNTSFIFNTACILLLLFITSCHTRKMASANSSQQPKFINGVSMDGHRKGTMTVSGSPDNNKAPDRPGELPPLTKREANAIHKKYAEIMGIKPKEITNNSLYEFIDEWYGVNYHLGGSDHTGIDCSAFAQKLYGSVYGKDLARTASEQFADCKRIKHSSEANEGDLVFFHVHSKHITHVGIYLTNDYFVHASTSQGVVISNLNDDYWHKYLAGIGRVKK